MPLHTTNKFIILQVGLATQVIINVVLIHNSFWKKVSEEWDVTRCDLPPPRLWRLTRLFFLHKSSSVSSSSISSIPGRKSEERMVHTLVLVVIETTQSHRRTVFLWPLAGSENHNRCGACKFCGCSSTNEWGKWTCHIENIQDICILFTEELQYNLQLLWMTHFNYWNSTVPSLVQSFSVVYRTTMLD